MGCGWGEQMLCGEEGVEDEAVAGWWLVGGVGAWRAVVPPWFHGAESPHAQLSPRTMGGCG